MSDDARDGEEVSDEARAEADASRRRDVDPDGPVVARLRRLVRGDVAWPRLLLAGLAAVVILAVVVALATSSAAFGAYNGAWDGAGDFRSALEGDADVTMAQSTTTYADVEANGTVAFVVAPADTYDPADADRVASFVENGGTLVVLENFAAPGNALLVDVGAEARFDGRLLQDERRHAAGPAMPIAAVAPNRTAPGGARSLGLNYATAVEPGAATVVAETSEYAHLGPETADLSAVDLSKYPVATVESVGEGTVYAIGDPSITINAMFDEEDNAAFLTGLAGEGERVLYDVSHADGVPPLWRAILTVRRSGALQALVGLGAIGALALFASGRESAIGRRLRARWRDGGHGELGGPSAASSGARAGLSPAERAALVRDRHPEWSDARVRQAITALNRPAAKGERE
ncbi:DUF4350 domain-containing protein [Halovivax limisalsi]|uniref:DUF4350 domain-containing protein n=1 Tax=Halovivax limisalsi TaxID=1453760 RepID=UPI001FFC9D45|nr:DUF4350 domain-containing protein [Halovivax limisalsi]